MLDTGGGVGEEVVHYSEVVLDHVLLSLRLVTFSGARLGRLDPIPLRRVFCARLRRSSLAVTLEGDFLGQRRPWRRPRAQLRGPLAHPDLVDDGELLL